MKKLLIPAVAVIAAFALARGAAADNIAFPAVHTGDVFVIAQTVNPSGAMASYFAPGSTVVFRAYAVDGKSRAVLTQESVKYFYVTIPNQPNVKLKYDAKAPGASGLFAWTGTWTIPSTYPTGNVPIKVLVQSKAKRRGSFVQVPVATAMLTVSATAQQPFGSGPGATTGTDTKLDFALYADSVNGTRPAAAAPRPVGCTQTNVFKRGEQFVLRTFGFELASGALLSIDNVSNAHFTVAGVPDITLNWGSHGPAKVFFWTNAWQIPADYPLGDLVVRISFTTTGGKTATLDYPITIVP